MLPEKKRWNLMVRHTCPRRKTLSIYGISAISSPSIFSCKSERERERVTDREREREERREERGERALISKLLNGNKKTKQKNKDIQ